MIYYDRPTQARAGRRAEDHRRGAPAVARRRSPRRRAPRASRRKSPRAVAAHRSARSRGWRSSSSRPSRSSRRPSRSTGAPTAGCGSARCTTTPPASTRNWQPGGRVKVPRTTPTATAATTRPPSSSTTLPFPTGVTAWGKRRARLRRPRHPLRPGHRRRRQGRQGREALHRLRHRQLPGPRQQPLARPRQLDLRRQRPARRRHHQRRRRDKVDIRSRDFRFRLPGRPAGDRHRPDAAGPRARRLGPLVRLRQQQRRCSTTRTRQRYLRRNPHAPAPAGVGRPAGDDYDARPRLPRSAGRSSGSTTPTAPTASPSACGLGIYRDTLLGEAYYGNAFVCEPVTTSCTG